MIQIVVKRDGRVVGYNEEKIMAAIRKAMLQTEMGEDEALIHKIVDRIDDGTLPCLDTRHRSPPHS